METNWIEKAGQLSLNVRNFVDGTWQSRLSGHTLEKHSPRDGALLYELPAGTPADANRAVASARAAFEDGRWSRLPVQRWKDALFKLAALIDHHREELALLECLDVGKPISDALNFDVPSCSAWVRYCAEAADKHHGMIYGADRSSLAYQLRRPVGVVAGIVGWNFPLFLAIQKVAPVLATGNSLVLKPSEWTSLSASRLAELAVEAGVPPGVFNVVHGDRELGSILAHHTDVDLLTFTGSTRTGKALLVASGQSNMKRLILECGGKAPNLVFDDAPDLEGVADALVSSAYWNQGQVCVASSRLLVQESIKEEFLRKVYSRLSDISLGDPLDPTTRHGALVSRAHLEKVLGYVGSAERGGAHLAFKGRASSPLGGGFYVAPHVFDQVSSKHALAQEEVFGPVLSVLSFRDEAEAVRIANDTVYGLSGVVWTRDLGRALRVSQGVHVGLITVNATVVPEGGPGEGVISVGGHKQSGVGVEGGIAGLEGYTTSTTVQYFV